MRDGAKKPLLEITRAGTETPEAGAAIAITVRRTHVQLAKAKRELPLLAVVRGARYICRCRGREAGDMDKDIGVT